MRCCRYWGRRGLWWKPLYLLCRVALRHYSVKYGFQIPWQADIGPGLSIGHFGPIIVNPSSRIGVNCNLTVGVLLGLNYRMNKNGGGRFEYPEIGDRVSLGNGSKIIGGVRVGSGSMVGVNTVVTKDIPDNSIVVGVPAKIISQQGSAAYVGSFHPWTLTLLRD